MPPGEGTCSSGVLEQNATCNFSGSYQVVMSSELPKTSKKNKQHG
jgi:hypothetical protein